MSHADDVEAYAAYLNSRERAETEYDSEGMAEFKQDFDKAFHAMTKSWLIEERKDLK